LYIVFDLDIVIQTNLSICVSGACAKILMHCVF